MNFIDRNIGELFAVLIGNAIDQHGTNSLKLHNAQRLTLVNIGDVDHVALAAVAVKAFAVTRIVDNILREALADHQTH